MEEPSPVQPAAGMPEKNPLTRLDYLIAVLIFAAVVVQGFWTMHQVGISWDEPYYFAESKRYLEWFLSLGRDSFSADALERTFGFNLYLDNHPTLFKIAGALSYGLFRHALGGFWAYRFSAVAMFGILIALIYLRASRAWGRAAGAFAAACTLCLPRLFIYGHIETTEIPLCLFWFAAASAFEAAGRRRSLFWLAGICYGLCMSVKFTGWLLPVPVLVWLAIYHRKRIPWVLLSMIVIGPLVFFALQPEMWHNPPAALMDFLRVSLTRRSWAPRWVLFLGKRYPTKAPWYYAPLLTAITVPAVSLALCLWGTARAIANRLKDEFAGACLIQFCWLIAMTMSPNAPTYDGVRLFIPAFVFLGLLAGYGFDGAMEWLKRPSKSSAPPVQRNYHAGSMLVAMLLLLGAAAPLIKVYPYGLEYYNELIGGIQGARTRGMETTHLWTVLNEQDLAKLNKALPQNCRLRFFPMDPGLWELYQELGLLRPDIKIAKGRDFDYILILSRPYWNYGGTFRFIGISQRNLESVKYKMIDGVPLWVLYRAPPGTAAAP